VSISARSAMAADLAEMLTPLLVLLFHMPYSLCRYHWA
jgi:hypothetical protein